jgi:predicted transcriptional regulator
MAKKRGRIDIILDMLTSIQEKGGEIKPTHLMYKANLAHRQLKSYLEGLVEKNFVKRIRKKNYEYIIITDDGQRFVQKIREMKEFEKTFGF